MQESGPVIGLWQEGEPIQVYHTEPLPLSLWGSLRGPYIVLLEGHALTIR